MSIIRWQRSRWALLVVMLVLAIACGGRQDELPANPGYLRAASSRVGNLTIFDANTFEIYRSVNLPRAIVAYSHRMEFDQTGRIWIGSSQAGIDRLVRKKDRVLVFSPRGDLEHELDLAGLSAFQAA